jgi:phosphoenolpyruvate-protein kinase (PTS system EI component)
LRSLSMTPSLIPHIKRIVRSVDIGQCERIARKAGSFDSDSQVSAYLRELTRAIIPEAFDGRSVNQR